MIARIHKSMREKDQGFTLIELLVVMIIIGILAAIAIPVFLNQRAKARDTSTKADVSNIGKEIAAYYVEPVGDLVVSQAGTVVTMTRGSGATATTWTTNVSQGTAITGATYTPAQATSWCVAGTNPQGDVKAYAYRASTGLAAGTC